MCIRDRLGEIAERQQMERALRESDERYDLAMKGAREGLWHWTATTKLFHVSPHVSEILGFNPPIATLSVPEWLALIHPDDLSHFREVVRAYYRGDTEFFECELRMLRPDGICRWVFNRGLGLRDREGFIYRAAGSIGDITEQKRAAEEHERLTAQLRHAQKMEAVGTLAGGIAHEFNNLLGVILGYTEMARQTPPDDPRAAQYLKQVLVAGKRAKAIVNQILTFSRRGESVRKTVDIQRSAVSYTHLDVYKRQVSIRIGPDWRFRGALEPQRVILQQRETTMTDTADSQQTLAQLDELPVTVSFDLGESALALREVKLLQPGYAFELARGLERPVTVRANGAIVGSGELIQVGDCLGVRLVELFARAHG